VVINFFFKCYTTASRTRLLFSRLGKLTMYSKREQGAFSMKHSDIERSETNERDKMALRVTQQKAECRSLSLVRHLRLSGWLDCGRFALTA
jgi:hypothetical protein